MISTETYAMQFLAKNTENTERNNVWKLTRTRHRPLVTVLTIVNEKRVTHVCHASALNTN